MLCYSQVGIAMGVLITAEGLCAIVIAIIVFLCWSCSKRKSVNREFDVSTNMSYGKVLREAEGEELYTSDDNLYMNDDKPYTNDLKLYKQCDGDMPSPKESPATKPELPLRMPQQKRLQVKGDS